MGYWALDMNLNDDGIIQEQPHNIGSDSSDKEYVDLVLVKLGVVVLA